MLLRDHLNELTRQELLEEARSFELKRYSGLRKAELIDRLVENFCTEKVLRSRIACLTKEQMNIYRRACVEPQEISVHEVMDGMMLYRYWLGAFDEITDKFTVFDEVSEIFHKIDDEAFRAEQHKKSWMIKCLLFFKEYYGIAPVEIVYKLYRLKIKDSIDEMIDMLSAMPTDIVESCIFPMNKLGLHGMPEDYPIYSKRGLLIHIPILHNNEFGTLLDEQMDKAFYIPSAQQIEELSDCQYEASAIAYRKLEKFFIKRLHMPYEHAVTYCLQIWAGAYEGKSIADILEEMMEYGMQLDDEGQIAEIIQLMNDAYNNTRMKENRGHSPNEMLKYESAVGMPTIVPGSTHAARMLKDAAPYFEDMGVKVDLEASADTISTTMYPDGLGGKAVRTERKIYPNDPCPCGSGKKYKKCCGKK